jgi:hypothetical protein
VSRSTGIACLWRPSAGLVFALLVLAVPLCAAAGAIETGVPPQLSESESELLARTGAGQALAAFVPPAGAMASPGEPQGDGGSLAAPFLPQPRPGNLVELYRWWTAPESPAQLIAAMPAPAGSRVSFSENPEGEPGLPSGIEFSWPAVARARGRLSLEIQAVSLSGGRTGIRALADGFWLRPRSPSEAIPSGMRLLRITVIPYGDGTSGGPILRPRQRPLTVTSRTRIERVVQLVNSLPVVQEPGGPAPCPAPRGVTLRLAFYTRPRGTPAAVIRDDLVSCGGVQLDLSGHEQPPLTEEGELPEEISEAIGRKIDVSFTEARRGS